MSTNTHVTYPWTKRFPFAVILLVVGLILFLAVTVPQPVIRFAASGSGSDAALLRAQNADAARYTAMAEYYAAQAGLLRGRAADAARYTAMAESFSARAGSALLRGRAADAARYTAMAAYFAARESNARFLTNWAAEVAKYAARKEAANLQRGRAADAARYTAMANYYAAMLAGR